jgi:hypothetical protein
MKIRRKQTRTARARQQEASAGANPIVIRANEQATILCRANSSAAGPVLGGDAHWEPGKPIEFMWMPAGVHTIVASTSDGRIIQITVQCDEETASVANASLQRWREQKPKQEPFGCVEHREAEAAVRVTADSGFVWRGDGVWLKAVPTTLGAEHVNGGVHRSWSPSFTTDADFDNARIIPANGKEMIVFPEGVRGSRSNPARITGVDFVVGSLTNKPAFSEIEPLTHAIAAACAALGMDDSVREPRAKRPKGAVDACDEGCGKRRKLRRIRRDIETRAVAKWAPRLEHMRIQAALADVYRRWKQERESLSEFERANIALILAKQHGLDIKIDNSTGR